MIKLGFIALGCPKNQVDSELMLGILSERSDLDLINEPAEADVIIINTCGFIQDAKEEAIETIIEAGRLKEEGELKALIVTGCLTQRYREELIEELPEIDAILGTGNFGEISRVLDEVLQGHKTGGIDRPDFDYQAGLTRIRQEPHFAYLKIAEGCSNNCTYCSIPMIRGPLKSREIEDISAEAERLALEGVKELILVAQDTTLYGQDMYAQPVLERLLRELLKIKELSWIRLLYSYPEHLTADLVSLMAEEEIICNYLDLPVQHSADRIRKKMGRRGDQDFLLNKIKSISNLIPDITFRTSLIVGFPGESQSEFEDLLDFIREARFDRLGAFKYSPEEGTAAAGFPEQIPEEIKEMRYQQVMKVQQKIAFEKNQQLIGRKLKVIIDEIDGDSALARSEYDAPEIDNQIYLPAANLSRGEMVDCIIREAYEYDLLGEIVDESTE